MLMIATSESEYGYAAGLVKIAGQYSWILDVNKPNSSVDIRMIKIHSILCF